VWKEPDDDASDEALARRQRILIYLDTYWSQHPERTFSNLVGAMWFLPDDILEQHLQRLLR
jgi:hypothetical protein